jgi:hypothetical protein
MYRTVIKKRTRQQTVTVDNNNTSSKEIAAIFDQIQNVFFKIQSHKKS